MEKTHWKKLHNPDYLGSYSLDPGKDLTVEIVSVSKQIVKGSDGKEDECIVAVLKGQKPMILNTTNCKTISSVFETPYIEEWKGKSITLYTQKIKAFGELVDALRVRSVKVELPELTPTHPKWAGAVTYYRENHSIEPILKKMRLSEANKKLLIEEGTTL